MRALVTGISGFVGSSLSNFLVSDGWDVTGFDQRKSEMLDNIHIGSIHDQAALTDVIRICQPDVIFHLAGVIKSQQSKEYFIGNVLGTLSLFESLLETGLKPRVVIASSSAVYGPRLGKHPITENFALRPATDYAASKVAQEVVARRFFLAYNFPVIIVRTFNLIGPGQPPNLACSSFAQQIALAEHQKENGVIKTGGLSAQRDFVDVRDAVQAYELLARKGTAGEAYNICSGKAVSIHHCLDLLLGMATRHFRVELDTMRLQKNDVPVQTGSMRLVEKITGWQPQISLKNSLSDLLNDWRERVKSAVE